MPSIALSSFWQHYVSVTSSLRFASLSPSAAAIPKFEEDGCIKCENDGKFDHREIRKLVHMIILFFYNFSPELFADKIEGVILRLIRMSRITLLYEASSVVGFEKSGAKRNVTVA